MAWANVIKDLVQEKHILITRGMRIDADDPRYDEDVHVVPVSRFIENGVKRLSFCGHEFSRKCFCSPEVREHVNLRTAVIHKELN